MSVTGHPHPPRISPKGIYQPIPEAQIQIYCFLQMAFCLNIKTTSLALSCPPYYIFYHLTSFLHTRWALSGLCPQFLQALIWKSISCCFPLHICQASSSSSHKVQLKPNHLPENVPDHGFLINRMLFTSLPSVFHTHSRTWRISGEKKASHFFCIKIALFHVDLSYFIREILLDRACVSAKCNIFVSWTIMIMILFGLSIFLPPSSLHFSFYYLRQLWNFPFLPNFLPCGPLCLGCHKQMGEVKWVFLIYSGESFPSSPSTNPLLATSLVTPCNIFSEIQIDR